MASLSICGIGHVLKGIRFVVKGLRDDMVQPLCEARLDRIQRHIYRGADSELIVIELAVGVPRDAGMLTQLDRESKSVL